MIIFQLRRERKKRNLTLKQLADKVGTDLQAISKYERGVKFPRPQMIIKLANALECEVRDLF